MAKATTTKTTKKNTSKGVAKTKSSAKKTASPKKSATKRPGEAKKIAPKTKKTQTLLTSEQRRKLLKPRDGFEDLVERIARTWDSARSLRVPGLSKARLLKLLRDARRTADREEAAREKLERMLRPLYDARLLAENAVWRAVLDVNAAVKLFARSDGALAETFGFVTEALTTSSGTRSGAEAEAAATSGTGGPEAGGS